MRSKVVLSASGLALLILAPAIYFHFAPNSPSPDQSAPAPEQVAVLAPDPSAVPAVVPHHHRTIAPADGGQGAQAPDDATADTPDTHEEYIAQRQAELTQLGMSDDPADLRTILSELNNKEPEIRSSALSAAVQFGDRDTTIPALQNELGWTEDPQEKVDIMNAIKYLQLPSFEDVQANLAAAAPQPSDGQSAPSN
jgi:hypothetical protein